MSLMAWRRAGSRLRGVMMAWLAAWSRATRTVTVKEIRSGSIPACLGGFGFQGAQRLVDGEEREQFLADQFG